MYGVTRATATLIGAGLAGFLLWLGTQFADSSSGGYWARYGIAAAAGLVVALSQLLGGWTKWGMPRLARPVFLFAFVPALAGAGWILLFHEPGANWFGDHVIAWSGDLGIDGIVADLGSMVAALAFGLGLVIGLSFDTTGPRRRDSLPEPVDAAAADQALTAERVAEAEPDPVDAPAEPEPEPPPRNAPPGADQTTSL